MICKNCGKELPEGSVLCCFCAEPVEEATVIAAEDILLEQIPEETTVVETAEEIVAEPAPKKTSIWIIILAAIAGLALVAVLAGAILYSLGINPFAKNDVLVQENYTVEDDVARENKYVVVATIADRKLTNGELQIYYWETVYNFVNSNYYYLSMYGLDLAKPLDQQTCPMAEGQTWQQFFLESALSTWQRYTTLQLLGEKDNYQVDAEMQTFLDDLPNSMQTNATNYGFDSVIAWLESNCGPGVSESGYLQYVTSYYTATFYLTSRYDDLKPTAADVEAYFVENEETFTQQGVTKESGKYYDVRHILIGISGGTENAEGTVVYTDEDWENCRKEAQALLDEWAADDGTEEGFGSYAMLYSGDGGSSTNGGLYSDLTAETNFVQEFKDWYLDEQRQPGDTGLVKSTYGYHIMYFSGSSEVWFDTASEQLMADRVSNFIDAGIEETPMKVNYRKIMLGYQTIS